MTATIRRLRLFALLFTIAIFAGCERSTRIGVEGGTTPVFVLSGSGKLASLVVYSPDFAEKAESPWDENLALWKISPIGGYMNGTLVGQLDRISYGVVPDGYRQVKPPIGSAPALIEGQKYSYDVETTNAPGAAGFLEIRNSKAKATDGPHTCFGREGKKWVRVACDQ